MTINPHLVPFIALVSLVLPAVSAIPTVPAVRSRGAGLRGLALATAIVISLAVTAFLLAAGEWRLVRAKLPKK